MSKIIVRNPDEYREKVSWLNRAAKVIDAIGEKKLPRSWINRYDEIANAVLNYELESQSINQTRLF